MGARVIVIAVVLGMASAAGAQEVPAEEVVTGEVPAVEGGGGDLTGGVGGFATVGSEGRSGVGVYGDIQRRLGDWEPLGWMQLRSGEDEREFSLGGGVWRNLGELWAKGALGLGFGRDVDTEESLNTVGLSGALERRTPEFTAGADYLYSTGDLPRLGSAGGTSGRSRSVLQRRRDFDGTRATYSYHELGGYGSVPVGEAAAGMRIGFGVPSYGGLVTMQEASLSVPVAAPLSAFGALGFEQFEGDNDVILSLGLDYRFF